MTRWNLLLGTCMWKVGKQRVVACGSSRIALPIVLLDSSACAKSKSLPPDPGFPV